MYAPIHIYHTICPDNLPEAPNVSFLSKEYQEQFHAFTAIGNKLSYYYSKVLLCRVLQEKFGINDLRDIQHSGKEKPYVPGIPQFNISHSGKHILIAIAETINKKYFSATEWQQITENELAFFDIWTIKEAAIKADGRGMSILRVTSLESKEQVKSDEKLFFYYNLGSFLSQKNISATIASDAQLQIIWHEITL